MLVSIVTPSFQQKEFIEETLRSVHAQGVPVEHVVIDGGSTDGSREIIESFGSQLKWWCSEKDKGQSHAINKGLAHCSGDVFNWLNSDDVLTPNALKLVTEKFNADPKLLVLGGRIIHRKPSGDTPFEYQTKGDDKLNYFIDHAVLQPATWWRKSVVDEIGGVEEKLRFVMDYELWLQFVFRYGVDGYGMIENELAIFRMHESSKTTTSHNYFLDEMASVLHGLCCSSGAKDLAGLLPINYTITENLRPIPINDVEHPTIIRKMVYRFLFKWNGVIGTRKQFEMMRSLILSMDPSELSSDDFSRNRYEKLLTELNVPAWSLYRLKRKFSRT